MTIGVLSQMKIEIGDLVQYHSAGRTPKIGVVTERRRVSSDKNTYYWRYMVTFGDGTYRGFRGYHLEVVNESR
jgi:hypothetical protein